MELLQRLLVRRCARLEWNRRVILEDGLDAGNVVALARRLATELFRLFDSGPAFLLLFRRRRRAERIVETRDCLGPIRHRAGRICLQNRSDRRIHLFPVERVQERGGGVEPRLRLVVAGDWKVHLTERAAIVFDGRAPEEWRGVQRESRRPRRRRLRPWSCVLRGKSLLRWPRRRQGLGATSRCWRLQHRPEAPAAHHTNMLVSSFRDVDHP